MIQKMFEIKMTSKSNKLLVFYGVLSLEEISFNESSESTDYFQKLSFQHKDVLSSNDSCSCNYDQLNLFLEESLTKNGFCKGSQGGVFYTYSSWGEPPLSTFSGMLNKDWDIEEAQEFSDNNDNYWRVG